MDINKIRADFPVTNNCAYFQSAGMSPVPIPVLEKIVAGYLQLSEYGDIHWQKDAEMVKQLYFRVAGMCGCSEEDVVFAESNSAVMSYLALALKKQHTSFNIVSMEEEFPSNTVPFEYQGIEMRYVQPVGHRYPVADIMAMCDGNTLAVLTSHVQYGSGFRQDIATLGKELKQRGIMLFVNTTQGFPFFPLHMEEMHIDVLTCSVHKWGFCGHVGTLFMTSSAFRATYPSPVAGWLSVDVRGSGDFIHTAKNKAFTLWSTAQQYDFASADLKGRLGLKYSLDYLEFCGMEDLRQHIAEMRNYLVASLKKLPVDIISPADTPEEQSAIVCFSCRNRNNAELVAYLESRKVIVALRNGYVRASVNVFTSKGDVDLLCGVMGGG